MSLRHYSMELHLLTGALNTVVTYVVHGNAMAIMDTAISSTRHHQCNIDNAVRLALYWAAFVVLVLRERAHRRDFVRWCKGKGGAAAAVAVVRKLQ